MWASELIKNLQQLVGENGDLPVESNDGFRVRDVYLDSVSDDRGEWEVFTVEFEDRWRE